MLIALSSALSVFMAPRTVYDYTVKDIDGREVSLDVYRGKTLLIVNVASRCGYTPQYKDLQSLYERYSDAGLVVLGFPSNDFMGQEPGSNQDIKSFCSTKYNVTFPMFSKIEVTGKGMHPLYSYLTKKAENGVLDAPVKWNFQKFLINKKGQVVTSFSSGSRVTDDDVLKAILAQM
jgi:glutathione peroxidase